MAKVNVAEFATELKLPVEKLVEQLKAAGVKKALSEETALTEGDKTKLLEYLRKAHGATEGKKKITLTRRQTSEIRKTDGRGPARTIQVEVRKKRVLVKRDAVAESNAAAAEAATPVPAPAIDADQEAARSEEARKQAELLARQAADLAAKEEERKRKADRKAEETATKAAEEEKAVAKAKEEAPAKEKKTAVAAKKAATEGTLHKPAGKPATKKPAKRTPTPWKEDAGRRRTMKTRGAS